MSENRPTIQVRNRTPLGLDYTENLQLEGNKHNRLRSYTDVWMDILVPRGGLESLLLQGLLYTCSTAFAVSIGGYVLVVAMLIITGLIIGGFCATVFEPKLMLPYALRCLMIAIGFVITML